MRNGSLEAGSEESRFEFATLFSDPFLYLSISYFPFSISNSIRIPRHVAAQGYGYLEDRRPASNIDPYRVTGIIVETTLLDA